MSKIYTTYYYNLYEKGTYGPRQLLSLKDN